jgi:1-acyl-sn-glycerol-3-phosphate acyltransferase
MKRRSSSRGGPELGLLRAGARALGLSALVALALPPQLLVLACTRGRASMRLPLVFHRCFARLAGLQVEYLGTPVQGAGVVHVSNHLSYLDVTALGQRLPTRFVAKEEVRGWPLFGLLAKLQQTVFVSRRRHQANAVGDALSRALDGVHGLTLFPEGTTSDGAQLLPFKSAAFAPLAARPGLRLQLVRIEVPGDERERYAYHGDDTLLPHFWRFLGGRGARVRVHYLEVLVVAHGADRKALSQEAWRLVAGAGAARETAPA